MRYRIRECCIWGGIYLSVECKVEHRWRGSIFFPYVILAEYEIGVLWNRILFTMLLMKCDDKITYYNASLAPGPHMHADYVTRMA